LCWWGCLRGIREGAERGLRWLSSLQSDNWPIRSEGKRELWALWGRCGSYRCFVLYYLITYDDSVGVSLTRGSQGSYHQSAHPAQGTARKSGVSIHPATLAQKLTSQHCPSHSTAPLFLPRDARWLGQAEGPDTGLRTTGLTGAQAERSTTAARFLLRSKAGNAPRIASSPFV
jgi:hypothetical protein